MNSSPDASDLYVPCRFKINGPCTRCKRTVTVHVQSFDEGHARELCCIACRLKPSATTAAREDEPDMRTLLIAAFIFFTTCYCCLGGLSGVH